MIHRTALLALCLAFAAPALASPDDDAPKRSVIYFIGDGMGTDQITLGRLGAHQLGQDYHLDRFRVIGLASTRSANLAVTDSAASGTALATGVKTDNKVIGLDPKGTKVQSILEAAHACDYMTGLVTTTRITHATPASFAAHVKHRKEEAAIADQLVERGFPEVMIGGGRRNFSKARLARLEEHGYALVEDPAALAAARPIRKGGRPRLAGLLAQSHIPYKVDGGARVTLQAMTEKAVSVLSEKKAPFFLMVEGGRIDHACHQHDAISALREQIELDEAVGWALDRAAKDPNLLIVVTADHATGSLGISERIDIDGLLGAKASAEALGYAAGDLTKPENREAFAKAVLEAYGFRLTDADLERIASKAGNKYWAPTCLGHIASEKFGVYYYSPEVQDSLMRYTHGHDGSHVPVFAYGPEAERFMGTYENTEVPKRIAAILGLGAGVEKGGALAPPARGTGSKSLRRPEYFK